MVDSVCRYRQHAHEACTRCRCQQIEYYRRTEDKGRAPRDGRGSRVTRVVEGFVASHPGRKSPTANDAKRNGCNRRRKYNSGCVRDAL